MFGTVVNAIKNGDLDGLKEILDKEPALIGREFKWDIVHLNAGIYHDAKILHIAASYNQPKIIEYLVTEKGMSVHNQGYGYFTPLHHAASAQGIEAANVLLELGANPYIEDSYGKTSFDRCKDETAKELLRSAYQEQQRKKALEQQEKERLRLEEAEKAAAAKLAGQWKPVSAHEIMFERYLTTPALRFRDIFDFAAKSRRSLTNDLQAGGLSQETKTFDEILDAAGKAQLAEAARQLNLANGVPAETAPPAGTKKQEKKLDYSQIAKAKM